MGWQPSSMTIFTECDLIFSFLLEDSIPLDSPLSATNILFACFSFFSFGKEVLLSDFGSKTETRNKTPSKEI